MLYKSIPPSEKLVDYIKSFWIADSEKNRSIRIEKIIPDGYPEIILHYRDPYKINITGEWLTQKSELVAGQITNHFYLENTGYTGMIGIKLQPWALTSLFHINMSLLVDNVVSFENLLLSNQLLSLKNIARSSLSFTQKIQEIEQWFLGVLDKTEFKKNKGEEAVKYIIKTKGEFTIQEISSKFGIGERALERYFKFNIGLPPKHFSRIIRFSNIFSLVQQKDFNWSDVSFIAGFYDQSHFIKNFKEFTGEEPSNYGFDKVNMANFFLNLPKE